jgi:PII-like signaling protein
MTKDARMMLIYMDEMQRHGEVAAYEAVVRKLLQLQIAGATATTGVMGFGRHHRVHRRHLLGVPDDRPVTVTAIDSEPKLREAAGQIRAIVPNALIVMIDAEILP